jgi:hypothetical protein
MTGSKMPSTLTRTKKNATTTQFKIHGDHDNSSANFTNA